MRLPYLVFSPSVTSPPQTRDLLNRIKRLRRGDGDVKCFRHILILCRGATTDYYVLLHYLKNGAACAPPNRDLVGSVPQRKRRVFGVCLQKEFLHSRTDLGTLGLLLAVLIMMFPM